MIVIIAEMSGLLSLLLNLNLAVCREPLRVGSELFEGGDEGDAMAIEEIRRGAELPRPPDPPRDPALLPRLEIPR